MASSNLTRPNNHSISRVIEVIRTHREVNRRLIARETGLSTPSITRLVNELILADILSVSESATAEGAGPGRPASVVKLNRNYCCAIGVDVGEHAIQLALGDMGGNIQLTSRLSSDADQGSNATFSNIVQSIESIRKLHESNFDAEAPPLRAITVGVPGTVDPDSLRVVMAPKIKDWTNFDLKEQLEARIPDVKIRIVNDINAAAIGESAHGVARGYDDFVFVSIRRGIGAGIFIGGKLHQGHSGFAGEMGKMVFDSSFRFSDSEGIGHLESICGEDPLLRQAKERGIKLSSTDLLKPQLNLLSLAAANGDEGAIEILKEFLTKYGVAIANIASLLDPPIIVVGGEIRPVMDMAVEHLSKTVGKLIPSPPKIIGSSLGEQAILQGTFYQAHRDACDTMLACQTVL